MPDKPNTSKYLVELKRISESGDVEAAHEEADDVLLQILADLAGYEEVIAAYEAIEKWYA